ncbi:MAG: PAS domain S-box protein [Acidobacteriota bacterium]
MSQLKLLLLEDLESDAELIKRQVSKAGIVFEAHLVDNHDDFVKELKEWRPDVILADYCLPTFDGLAALRVAKAGDPDIPFIFVSGAIPEDVAIEAVREGADDYVFKDRMSRLASSISAAMEKLEEHRKRRQAEEDLRESEERYRHLVELSPDGIIVHRNTEILFVNRAAASILGQEAHELRGRNFFDFLDPAYQALAMGRIRKLREPGPQPLVETSCRRQDGTVVRVEATAVYIPYQGDQAVLWIIRDVSEKKRLEREILEISGREQRRIGQDLHDTLGQNLAGAAFLGKALQQKLTRLDAALAEDASKIVSLITQSVSQARALSRGLSPVDIVANGLELALTELASNTREFFGVPCTFETGGECLAVDETTATHLYHIGLEAVNNAARHSGATRISILLSCENRTHVLTVKDNGRGLERKEEPGSKGMGLRIMDYRAKVIGASLDLQSGPGEGTTVTCTLKH